MIKKSKNSTKPESINSLIKIKVIPGASRNEIAGWKEEVLYIRIRAIAQKGAANEALIAFLADFLGIAKSSISILSGHASRIKRVEIQAGPAIIKKLGSEDKK